MANPNVMVVNSRRIADDNLNWRLGHLKLNDYLHDQVHYSTKGGRVLAEAEMNALLEIVKSDRSPPSENEKQSYGRFQGQRSDEGDAQ